MESNDFRKRVSYRVFTEVLLPLLVQNGFQLVTDGETNEYKFKKIYFKSRSDRYGIIRRVKVNVIGKPMGPRILLCFGSVEDHIEASVKAEVNLDERMEGIKKNLVQNFIEKLLRLCWTGLEDLPAEVKCLILEKLPLRTFRHMATLNSAWFELCQTDQIWKKLYFRDFGAKKEEIKRLEGQEKLWRTRYKEEYLRQKWIRNRPPPRSLYLALPPPPRYLPLPPIPMQYPHPHLPLPRNPFNDEDPDGYLDPFR